MHRSACARETPDIPCQRCGADPRLARRYQLLEEIDRGSSDITWRAEDPSGRICALWGMPLHGTPDARRDELLQREVRVLRHLHHPLIPTCYEGPGHRCVQLNDIRHSSCMEYWASGFRLQASGSGRASKKYEGSPVPLKGRP